MQLNTRSAFVLTLLLRGEAYGREIIARAAETSGGSPLSEGTLYPLLRDMEREGLLESRTSEPLAERGGRRRYYYKITGEGRAALHAYQQKATVEFSWLLGVTRA